MLLFRVSLSSSHATPLTLLQVGDLQNWIDMGRLQVPKDRFLTIKDIVDAGIFKANRVKHGIKLLAKVKDISSARWMRMCCATGAGCQIDHGNSYLT